MEAYGEDENTDNTVHADEDLSESDTESPQEEADGTQDKGEDSVDCAAALVDQATRDHRRNQRMMLQMAISAIIVTASGASLLVFRILRNIGYVVLHPTPSAAFFSSLSANIHVTLQALRITAEIFIVLGVFFAFAHRAIGFALGYYLRTMLDPEGIGQYQFHFDWISLRFGLDQNMLVLSGLEWRNPAAFTNTPYLLRIEEISFVIDPVSVFNAVCYDTAIKIREIKLDKAAIYIEKLTQRSIDRAATAAMKANGGQDLMAATGAEVKVNTSTPAKEGPAATPAEASTELDADNAVPKSAQSKHKHREPLRPGVLNLWAAMGATNPQQEASILSSITKKVTGAVEGTTSMMYLLGSAGQDVRNVLLKGAQSVSSSIGKNLRHAFGGKERERSGTLSSVPEEAGDDAQGGEHGSALSVEETLALLQAEYPDLVLPPLPEDAYDEEDRRHLHAAAGSSTPQTPQPESAEEKARRKKRRAAANKGFGVPYRLEIDFLLLHDVKVHAQDFLNASHQKESKASVIKLTTLGMMRNELTLSPDRSRPGGNGKRRGIYLDDVVWRLVDRLLRDLMRGNSMAMMMLLTSAMASHTTSAVSSAGGLASKGAVTSGKLLNQAASSVSSAVTSVFSSSSGGGSAGYTSPVRERAPSSGSNNGQNGNSGSSSTAQSALHMLNATGADVSQGARTALSSVGQFIKRTVA